MPEWIITIVVAVIMSIPGVLSFVVGLNKNKIETAEKLQGMLDKSIKDCERFRCERNDLKTENEDLKSRLTLIERKLKRFESGIELLTHQVESVGKKPIWTKTNGEN